MSHYDIIPACHPCHTFLLPCRIALLPCYTKSAPLIKWIIFVQEFSNKTCIFPITIYPRWFHLSMLLSTFGHPEGVDNLCFHKREIIPLPPPSSPSTPSNPSLEAQIHALRAKSQPQGPNPSQEAKMPTSKLIWASRLGSRPPG